MLFHRLVVIAAICATSSAFAQSPRLQLNTDPREVCASTCWHKDRDALFPSGSVDRQCVRDCLGGAGVAPPSPGVRPSGNNRAFILLEPMRYEVGSTGIVIEVPAGFVTDYASVPPRLWSLYSPHDQYSRAAVVHDYLYWSQLCTRTQADNLFMIAMRESEVAETTRNNVYAGVRTFGESAWERNRREREANKPKVVPLERRNFPPNWSWEMYRDYLIMAGVKDPEFRGNNYCGLGNSTQVPTAGRNSPDAKTPPKLATRAREGMDRDLFLQGPDWTPEQELRQSPAFFLIRPR